jgi:hypothetical protein
VFLLVRRGTTASSGSLRRGPATEADVRGVDSAVRAMTAYVEWYLASVTYHSGSASIRRRIASVSEGSFDASRRVMTTFPSPAPFHGSMTTGRAPRSERTTARRRCTTEARRRHAGFPSLGCWPRGRGRARPAVPRTTSCAPLAPQATPSVALVAGVVGGETGRWPRSGLAAGSGTRPRREERRRVHHHPRHRPGATRTLRSFVRPDCPVSRRGVGDRCDSRSRAGPGTA